MLQAHFDRHRSRKAARSRRYVRSDIEIVPDDRRFGFMVITSTRNLCPRTRDEAAQYIRAARRAQGGAQ
jgi:hypothetical protein